MIVEFGIVKMSDNNFFQSVYSIVKKIPRGKVTSYGRIASLLGHPRSARVVGYALNALAKEFESEIPWQRVINSKGKITFKGDLVRASLQKALLLEEGIYFDSEDCVDWKKQGWP